MSSRADRDAPVTSEATPRVSIIVVTYGTGTVVLQMLDAVARYTPIAHEVIVVDCLPPDATTRTSLLLAGRHDIELFAVDDNLGFAGGNEYGVEQSHGEYLCFLNADAIVGPGWLEPLIAALDDPDVGIAAPVFVNDGGSLQEAGQLIFPDTFTAPIGGDGVSGAPLLAGAAATFECFNRSQYGEGDHVIFVGEVEPVVGLMNEHRAAYFDETFDLPTGVESAETGDGELGKGKRILRCLFQGGDLGWFGHPQFDRFQLVIQIGSRGTNALRFDELIPHVVEWFIGIHADLKITLDRGNLQGADSVAERRPEYEALHGDPLGVLGSGERVFEGGDLGLRVGHGADGEHLTGPHDRGEFAGFDRTSHVEHGSGSVERSIR